MDADDDDDESDDVDRGGGGGGGGGIDNLYEAPLEFRGPPEFEGIVVVVVVVIGSLS
eukprot:CAMPEP_0118698524 /NCGR_PEP_ID=MMETSP0800-20121206/15258_1 /TAXON_ID=210618 ORGANISM="Striatella unipunctata, Strain CCMP2910" /NCGR_SAMPLE_ID=MMETSP0800 /ASSEMBLY_ACC=CAM_ASM_000638 /LENGTH=56 /DNA_ID=CAMNT_0006598373 /DNA_START=288 /DNA_END=458 /DNA_ORIENTATION=+